jgi:hypothetical protein
MKTGNRNGKSVKIYARISLELAAELETVTQSGETLTDIITAALRAEMERRRSQTGAVQSEPPERNWI